MPLSINVILGTASWGYKPTGGLETLSDKPTISHLLEVFKKHGGYQLDTGRSIIIWVIAKRNTARTYAEGTTETILGELGFQGTVHHLYTTTI